MCDMSYAFATRRIAMRHDSLIRDATDLYVSHIVSNVYFVTRETLYRAIHTVMWGNLR